MKLKAISESAAKYYRRLPITKGRLLAAGVLYRIIQPFIARDVFVVQRQGINYQIDIGEGFDLHLYLFGPYQKHVTSSRYLHLASDAVVFDVGANFGHMSLLYASNLPQGRVYSFEPTEYAWSRLRRNIELNPQLQKRIQTIKAFVTDSNEAGVPGEVFASWRFNEQYGGRRHPIHRGIPKEIASVSGISLDDFFFANDLKRIDLIKIDTDGHEIEVLQGAIKILQRFHPTIIFELGLYMLEEKGAEFQDFLEILQPLGYQLQDSQSGRYIDEKNFRETIPDKFTIDILATGDQK